MRKRNCFLQKIDKTKIWAQWLLTVTNPHPAGVLTHPFDPAASRSRPGVSDGTAHLCDVTDRYVTLRQVLFVSILLQPVAFSDSLQSVAMETAGLKWSLDHGYHGN
ncbi:hypothetical protein Bbelb_383290 [Branchiostoma belcheri]|nr:hypothetical protein Bbelb_383290 [Branchiostoma belcheri]